MSAVAKLAHVWERDPFDWYVEPESATRALLSVEKFDGEIYDPACGQGNIVRAFLIAGYQAFGTDIVDRTEWGEPWFGGCQDFLSVLPPSLQSMRNIVTNPPFYRAAGAEAFIRRALQITSGKVCVFVDLRFLAGDKRATGLFADHPPHRAYIITPRVSCPPGAYLRAGNKAGNGSSDWCWLVWDNYQNFDGTKLCWLRREKD